MSGGLFALSEDEAQLLLWWAEARAGLGPYKDRDAVLSDRLRVWLERHRDAD